MTVWRASRIATIAILFLVCLSCGDTFRPVAIPLPPKPPDPGGFHYVLAISTNGPGNPGGSTRVDVSGDTNVGVATIGVGPAHAALLPNSSRVYIANAVENSVSSYVPTSQTLLTTTSLPAGSLPSFVGTTESSTVYVANSGNGTVVAISAANNVITDTICLTPFATPCPIDPVPMALAETPDAKRLYVANQGNNTVTSINPGDKTVRTTITDPNIIAPVWVVVRSDSARAYVLSSGSGMISTIDTSSDTVLNSVAVDPGANFMFYDQHGNRLYVTNPTTTVVRSFNVSSDIPIPLATIDLSAGPNAPCPSGCSPVSLAMLPDDTRLYVATYQLVTLAPPCNPYDSSDLNPCGGISSNVAVVNAADNSTKTSIPLGTTWVDTRNPTGCTTNTAGMPVARFRLSVAAANDSSRVYVGKCDSGNVAVINTVSGSDNLVSLNGVGVGANAGIDTPLSAFPPQQPAGGQPPTQNPVFVLVGP
ncbi:MAG TPA: YncE family protein [Terriglobales bacterium]